MMAVRSRDLAHLGFVIAVTAIAVELVAAPVPSLRFPRWYPVLPWAIATWVIIALNFAAIFVRRQWLTRAAFTGAVVWCVTRAALNFYNRLVEPIPEGVVADVAFWAQRLVPGLLFLGFGLVLYAFGLGVAHANGRHDGGAL